MPESTLEYGPLETDRLLLAVPRADHAEAVFASFSSDPEVTRYLKWAPAESVADAEMAMAGRLSRLSSGQEHSWILLLKSDHAVIGSLSIWLRGPTAEIGFALARRVWGQGLAVEAGLAAILWLRTSPLVQRVWAACDFENTRSIRVLEKLGLQHDRLAPRFATHPNLGHEPRACHLFSLELVAA